MKRLVSTIKNWNITRLFLLFAVLFGTILIVVDIGSYVASNNAIHTLKSTSTHNNDILIVLKQSETNLYRMSSDMYNYLISGNQKTLTQYYNSERLFNQELEELIQLEPQLHPNNQQHVYDLLITFRAWRRVVPEVVSVRQDPMQYEPAYQWFNTDGIDIMEKLLHDTHTMMLEEQTKHPTQQHVQTAVDIADMHASFLIVMFIVRDYVETMNENTRRYSYSTTVIENEKNIKVIRDKQTQHNILNHTQQILLQQINTQYAAFVAGVDEHVFSVIDNNENRQDLLLFQENVTPLNDTMHNIIRNMIDTHQHMMMHELNSSMQELTRTQQINIGLMIFALVIGAWFVYLNYVWIVTPILAVTTVAQAIAQDNWSARAAIHTTNEIGTLATTFNAMAQRIQHTIHEQKQTIAERNAMNQKLQESRQQLFSFIDHSPSFMFAKDTEGRFLLTNKAFQVFHGISRDEIVGKTDFNLFPEPIAKTIWACDQQVLTTGTPYKTEEQVEINSHSRIYMVIKFPIADSDGTVYAVGGITTDITERKQMEEEIREHTTRLEKQVKIRTRKMEEANQELRQEIHMREQLYATIHYQASLLNRVSDAIISIAPDGTIKSWNNAAETMYGWREDDAIGHIETTLLRSAYGATVPTAITPAFYHVACDNGTWEGEMTQYRADNTPILVLSSITCLQGHNNETEGFVLVHRNITERKHAENALRASEERYRDLVETSPDPIGMIDLTMTLTFCNKRTAETFGYERIDAIVGNSMLNLFAPQSRDAFCAAFATTLQTGSMRHIFTMQRHDGTHFSADISVKLLLNEQQKPYAALGILHDITELQQAHDNLHSLNHKLRQGRETLYRLIDGLHDGLLLLDRNGVIQACNNAFAHLIGTTPDMMVSQLWVTLCHHYAPTFPCDNIMHHNTERSFRDVYVDVQGKEHILDIRAIPIHYTHTNNSNEDNDTGSETTQPHFIIHVHDVTESFYMEVHMIQNERYATSGRIAATVAHEINSPLSALHNMLHLAKTASSLDIQQYIINAQQVIERIGRILHRLVEHSRSNTYAIIPIDINEVIDGVLLLTKGTCAHYKIVVERFVAPDLPPFEGHIDHINQVILNMIVNAIDAMPHGGQLIVQTYALYRSMVHGMLTNETLVYDESHGTNIQRTTQPTDIVIEICDNGCGIPIHLQERIFEPFFTTKKKEGGSGMGLAISHKIISFYGGSITVESDVGCGATFTITLPTQANIMYSSVDPFVLAYQLPESVNNTPHT